MYKSSTSNIYGHWTTLSQQALTMPIDGGPPPSVSGLGYPCFADVVREVLMTAADSSTDPRYMSVPRYLLRL